MVGAGEGAGPITSGERIRQIDVIRGFALFGVLWMNIYEHAFLFMPENIVEARFAPPADAALVFWGGWLMQGKAQALFSLLFGFGFATILSRLEARGVDGARIFLRRTAILLVLGFLHFTFLWLGDILFPYALMGFVLFLMRKWSDRALLWTGLALCVLSEGAVTLYGYLMYGENPYWNALYEYGTALRWDLFRTADYPGYVRELFFGMFREWMGTPPFMGYIANILGRFMIGAWIFRQGWLQRADELTPFFRRVCLILLPLGIALGAVHAGIEAGWFGPKWLGFVVNPAEDLATALGYGAGIVLLCRLPALRWLTAGLGAAGRMALTNYLTHSVLFVLLLYGVGLGLLGVLDPVLSLQLALAIYAAQMVFSTVWLRNFRFGPMEWVWRSLTYGKRQPMRREMAATAVAA